MDRRHVRLPAPDNETKPGRAADNPLSKSAYDRHARTYYAKGFGSPSHAAAQNVRANGTRTDGGWAITFVRERSAAGPHDAVFDRSRPTYLAFAVWNGSADSAFSLGAFRDEHGTGVDLVSDMAGDAIRAYDLEMDVEDLGLFGVANRSVFLLDEAGTVTYRWIADEPPNEPDYEAVVRAAETA